MPQSFCTYTTPMFFLPSFFTVYWARSGTYTEIGDHMRNMYFPPCLVSSVWDADGVIVASRAFV